ncbi:Chaperone protein dnaJ 15 [Citrus sinensis]|uniref:Chaperone protein dnaJ 15 n=1 Tax=Citrus sinensis TaxID=2711 RepID=A0ACB8NAI0_CITSI|nr:Chaperone protein dnaJ 15 [Citrus sinensis]
MEGSSAPTIRRDPYEVLCVSRDSSDQEIKTAYRKLALNGLGMIWHIELQLWRAHFMLKYSTAYDTCRFECSQNGKVCLESIPSLLAVALPVSCWTNRDYRYHPDKNVSNPEAAELFKEVAYSYSILSDPEKRRHYDNAGFEVRWALRFTRALFYCGLAFVVYFPCHAGLSQNSIYRRSGSYSHLGAQELVLCALLRVFHVGCWFSGNGPNVKKVSCDWVGEKLTVPHESETELVFGAIDAEGMDMEIDLSNLGTVNTMFAALFSKLGVPIKTTISANVLEEALNGTVTVRPLPIGTSVSGKVEKQCAHFFGVTINDQQAEAGIVVRVTSTAQSKFKLLYFEQDTNGGYGLALQEDSEKTGKVTSAGMYFLHFQVYRMDSTLNAIAIAKDPESAFFKRLEGDNFFKTATYTIEALCAKSYEDNSQKLKDIEAQILRKRKELREFEIEYRKALARFQEATNRYSQEKQSVDELLKQRDAIHSSFTVTKTLSTSSVSGNNLSNGSSSKVPGEDSKGESPAEDGSSDGKDKSAKKKWFNLNLKGSDKKAV